LKAALAEGLPVVIGVLIYESFESPEVARTGKVPYPKKSQERVLGGHALLAVGYTDKGTSGSVMCGIVGEPTGETKATVICPIKCLKIPIA
jgi:C1A family cysteine protease